MAGACSSTATLLSRSVRMLDASTLTVDMLLMVLVALPSVLAAVLTDEGFKWSSLLGTTLRPSALFYLVILLQHRSDYGDHMLIVTRELHSGISVVGLYASLALRTLALVALKTAIYCAVVYVFNTPQQGFGLWYLSYVLGAWCWTGFTHWVTILVRNQMTAVLVAVIVQLLERLYDGALCAPATTDTFCPLVALRSQLFPPYWGGWAAVGSLQLRALWALEMQTFPAYTVNISVVNTTNYYYAIAPFEALQAPDYAAIEAQGLVGLLLLGLVHQCAVFLLLFSLQTWVRAALGRGNQRVRAAVQRALRCQCAAPYLQQTGLEAPPDVVDRLARQERASGLARSSAELDATADRAVEPANRPHNVPRSAHTPQVELPPQVRVDAV